MLLLAMVLGTGCSDDEEKVVCPAEGLPADLIGDWMELDDAGNATLEGMRIQQDGRRLTLGIDWRNGSIALAEEHCNPSPLFCAGDHRVGQYYIPSGSDTLSWSVNGDELTLLREGDPPRISRYRKVTLGSIVDQPAACSFQCTLGAQQLQSPQIWPGIPVGITLAHDGDTRELTIGAVGRMYFRAIIQDFDGPGVYDMLTHDVRQYASFSSTCTDAIEFWATRDDQQSTVTITRCDSLEGRCSGTFRITVYDYVGNGYASEGTFDAPLKTTP